MTRRDMREVVFRNAFAVPDLGNVERLLLIALCHLSTEYVDGSRRPGSQGMDDRGRFALHYDYLARALHTSPGNAKKMMQRLESKGLLSKRFPGTFGRPAGFQALDVRGDNTYRITVRRLVPPYEPPDPATRGDVASPLTYSGPTEPNHSPTSRDSRTPVAGVIGTNEEQCDPTPSAEVPACPWHTWQSCPEDCRHADLRRQS